MKSKKGVFTLATGREIKADRGILGISADGGRDLFHGYEGEIEVFEGEDFHLNNMDPDDTCLTQAEREEISAFMVELWKAWAKPV